MEQQFTYEVLEKLKRKKRKTIWKQILRVMMCLVVFCTTYMLILPAITKESKAFCGIEEHTHNAACYQEGLVCQEHVHTEPCFQPDGTLICDLPGHTHTVACSGQTLTCEQAEHTHLQSCFSDVTADVETEEDWLATLPPLTEVTKENIVSVAVSQLDYAESTLNYLVDSSGDLKGYTRYGAWYGDPYGDWNSMFLAFCLRYAGAAPPEDINCAAWAESLLLQEKFFLPSDHVPEPGDILFLDTDRDGTVDRLALVEALTDTQMTAIEGDRENRVARTTYDLFDAQIVGYSAADLIGTQPPEAEKEEEKQETEETPDIDASDGESAWAELIFPTRAAQTNSPGSSKRALTRALTRAPTRATALDLGPYINAVNMYDSNGNLIPSGSMVTEGESIEFKIEYTITGQQLAVMNGNTITVRSDTLEYQLPQIFEMVDSDEGPIQNSVGNIVGEYLIDSATGTIVMTFSENYVLQNATGMQIHGYISCFSTVKKVTDLDGEHQDFEFTDNITLGVVIEEKNDAVGDLSIEKENVSADGENLVYEIRVSSTEGTTGDITITDTMSKGLTFTKGLGVTKGNGTPVNNATFRPNANGSAFTLTLPEMAPGDSYIVSYECAADINLLDADMKVQNTASVKGKNNQDVDLEDDVTVDYTFDVLKKTGEINDNGTITWTITINQAKADISGWTLEDIMGGNTPYTGSVTIRDVSGNMVVRSTTLPSTFPNGSNKTYVVTYTTTHSIAEGDTIYNKAILKDNDTDVTVVTGVKLGTPIEKSGEAGEVIQDENGNFLVPITWTVTIDTTNSAIDAGQYFYDQMNGAYHTAELFMTYDQLKAALANMEAELQRVGSASGDVTVVRYAEGYSVGQSLSLANLERDPNRTDYLFERFSVYLTKAVPKGQLLTFTYETYGSFPNNVIADQDYKNCFNISQHYEVEGIVKFSSGTIKATKTALSYYDPSIPDQKWHWNNTDWNGVEGISRFEYEKLHDSYLAWSIELSVPPGYSSTDDLLLFEDLPEGVTVKRLGMPFFSDQPIPYLELSDIELGQTYYWTFMIHPVEEYDKWHASQRNDGFYTTITIKVTEDGDLEMTLPGDLLRLMGNLAKRYSEPEWYSYLFVYTQINDDFPWTPTSANSHIYRDPFQNRFTITDEDGEVIDIGSQTQIITKDESEGMIRKEAATQDNIINYSVVLNAYGKDLMGNSGYVAVHDELTYTSTAEKPLRVRLVPGSVKLYEIRLASDGSYTKLADVTPDYSYNETSTEEGATTNWTHTLDMTVPDGKTLLLEYSYKVSGDKNISHDILNSCTIHGVGETFLDGNHKLEIEVKDATAQADTKGIVLYKVDADSDGIFLENARFNIYIWNEDQQDYIIVHHPNDGSTDFKTDINGMILIDGSTINLEQFAYNTAYYIVEVESPGGYFLGPEPYYFYIAHENTVAYPFCLPDGFEGRALTSGDIIYRKNVNELTKIRVEKFWQDMEGNFVTVTDREVPSITLELWQMLQGEPDSAKRYGTYTVTPDKDGNWSLTITGLPKATRKADGTKGTDYLYYIKEVGVGGYELDSAENNAGINSGTIRLINRKTEGYLLPETGGIGTQMYTTAGLLLVLISTAFLVYNHRKRRREAYNSS